MSYAQEIRQAVLLAAVSGQLTVTFESDTPIEEYIQQLKVEKGVVGGERKARKGQNIDAITDEEIPCDIPTTWRYIRIIDVAKSISAGGDKPSNFSKEKTEQYSVPVISNGETNMGIFGYTDIPSVSELALTVSGRGTIGYSVIRNEPFVPIVRLLVILPLKGTNLQYIQLTLSALIEFGSGTAVKQLTVPMISPKVIPLPPPEEQQRIVDRVNELLAKVDEFEKIENRLTAVKERFPSDLRAAILQAAMQGKLTEQLDTDSSVDDLLEEIRTHRDCLIADGAYKPNKKLKQLSDEDVPFDIPDSWRWIRLGYCSTYGQTKLKASEEECKSDIWSLDLEDIEKTTGRVISRCRAKDRQIGGDKVRFFKGNILYSKLRPYLLKVLIADEDGICSPELITFDMIGGINPKYILWVLRSPHVDYVINSVTYGVKMPRVGTETMINLLIPLPPIEEQQRIVERLDALLPLCDDLVKE